MRKVMAASWAHRLECGSHFGGEELWLLPGGEVATLVDFVEVGEAGVDRFGPAARGGPDLAGECREADRNCDRRRRLAARKCRGERSPVFPVRSGCRRGGAGQP